MKVRAVAGVMLLLASGCSNDAAPGEAGPASFDLRVAITNAGSLDPAKTNGRAGLLVLKQICDPLVTFDQLTGALKPGLAESWTVSDDAKTFKFQIRPGVKFHNGREVVAEDFVYSLMRIADPQVGSPHHYLLEKVLGYSAVRAGTGRLTGIRGQDPRVLEIELSEPYMEFPALLAHPATGSPVAREDLEADADKYGAQPTCTGPYRIDSNGEGAIRTSRFADYYGLNGSFSRGGSGYADRIEFLVSPNLGETFKMVADGKADVAPIAAADLIEAKKVAGRVESGQSGHVAYIGFPTDRTPYGSAELRRRMAEVIDRGKLVNELLGGSRAYAAGFLPSTAGPISELGECTSEPAGDVQAPSEVPLYLNTGGGHEAWLQQVADDWQKALNIKTTLKTMSFQEYVDFLAAQSPDGPFRLSWAVNYPSPEALLNPLFTTGSPNNFTRYSSSEYDALMSKARATVDDAERLKVYTEAAKLLCRDQPILPVWFGVNHVAFAPKLQSVLEKRLDVFGDPILRELRFTS